MTGLRVAERWFETRRVSDDVTLVFEPHVDPLIRCNIWHVRGRDTDMVIDTGLGVAPLAPVIAELTDRPVIAVATHIHYDHVGGLHEFDCRLMHEVEADRMENYGEFAALETRGFDPVFVEGLRAAGYDVAETLVTALPEEDYDLAGYAIQSTSATRRVAQGDMVDLGDRHFEVLHLPGHSPGSMGLWEAATGTLFSGDAIYDGPLLDGLEDSDIQAYIATMKRLRELPVTVVHGGHDPSFGRTRMIEIADQYLAFRDQGYAAPVGAG